MMLFPQDGYMPPITVTEPEKVRKVVVKTPVKTLPTFSEPEHGS
jgi:beta-galactosidase beta subunit